MSVGDHLRAELQEGLGLFVRAGRWTTFVFLFLAPCASAGLHLWHGSPIGDLLLGMLIGFVLGATAGVAAGLLTGGIAIVIRVTGVGGFLLVGAILLGAWSLLWLLAPWIDPHAATRTEGALRGLVSLLLSPLVLLEPKGLGKMFVAILLTMTGTVLGSIAGALLALPAVLLVAIRRLRARAAERTHATRHSSDGTTR